MGSLGWTGSFGGGLAVGVAVVAGLVVDQAAALVLVGVLPVVAAVVVEPPGDGAVVMVVA